MTFSDWLFDTVESIQQDRVQGCKDAVYDLYLGIWRRIGRVYNYGEPIYERDWDVLIVLDACRADLMAAIASEYEFASTATTHSVASTSAEWMIKNFDTERYRGAIERTAYVSGNPFTDEVCFIHQCPDCGADRERVPGIDCDKCGSKVTPNRIPDHEFQSFDEVWQYGWDDDLGTIPPNPLTDRAIETWRDESPDHMIIHYMQPHHPFVDSHIQTSLSPEGFGEMGRESVWDLLRDGEVSKEAVWRDYIKNLEYVLDDVSRLLNNIDADRVVLTADHGNAIGEFGLYGHYRNVPLNAMKRVPWCETSASNVEDYKPDTTEQGSNSNVQERLEDLGYM